MRSVSASDVHQLEKKLLQTFEMIVAKKKRIALANQEIKRQEAEALKRSGSEASSNSWWRKISNVASPRPQTAIHENIPLLKVDVSALEELSRQLFMEIHDMQNMLERIEWSKTFQGKYFNFLGYFFSLYCTWKYSSVQLTSYLIVLED